MDRECDDADENTQLLSETDRERTTSDLNLNSVAACDTSSQDTIVFDSKMMKTSTHTEDLAATWGGRRSLPDSGRLRRVHSWSGGPPDDISSEIRILRERYLSNSYIEISIYKENCSIPTTYLLINRRI